MSFWKEIRNNHIIEECDGYTIITIDAWETDDDCEEGTVIADVIGKKVKDEDVIFVNYRDGIARFDEYAQEMINEAKEKMRMALNL